MPEDTIAPRSPSRSPEPSPHREEDLAGAHQWSDDEAEHLDPSNNTKDKGKGKARDVDLDEEDDPEYPPVTDEDAETRRIEENLKRWEVAERMKRKTARESALVEPPAPSLLSDVTRRASLLWPGRRSQNPHNINPSLGTHAALNSEESVDVVPLDDIAATPTPSPTHSESSNPFTNPQTPDPFSDAEAVMSPSAEPPPPTPQMENEDAIALTPQRPALLTASSSMSFRRPPTPKPLGLPPPRAPPPPLAQSSPPPIPVPDVNEEEPKTRWWHEWLCGFGEGSDRGGDNQAGRTNPFE
ncbi:hypothetical protein C8R47DRAFT_986410 [Mycena vitilis]|nr:hypothetical protein C8R47DRAFT_986410 [Mycena vitilis]